LKQKSVITDLTSGNVWKQMFKFALPFMLANFLQTFYNMVDMIIIGQYVGKSGLSAVSIGGDTMNFLTFICMGLAGGGQIIISQSIGKKDYEALGRTIGTLVSYVFTLAIVFMIVGFLCVDWFLGIMNVPAEAYAQAKDYIIVCFIGLIPIYGYNIASSILRGMGNSKAPLIFIAIATVLNLVLDYIFVVFFHWDALGTAIATVIGQTGSFVSATIYLYKRRDLIGFDFKLRSIIPDKKILITLIKLGIPMAIQSCAINISALFVNSHINSYGVVVSAVSGVGNKINAFANAVSSAMNMAGAAMIGQNFGARKLERIPKVVKCTLLTGLCVVTVVAIVMWFAPEFVFSLFNKDPEVLEMAWVYRVSAVVNIMSCAFRAPFMSLLNGIGFVNFNFIIGILDGVVVRIGLAMLLGVVLDMGALGFWLGSAIAGYTYLVVGGPYYLSGKWRNRKPVLRDK